MYRSRVIPVLLINDGNLVKTKGFKEPTYVGDPVNAVRIFNEKEVDELVVLDITKSEPGTEPDYSLIQEIAGECFMPICYGGRITTFEIAKKVFDCGVEKICINSAAMSTELISEIARVFGSQSVVIDIDFKKKLLSGYTSFIRAASEDLKLSPVELAKKVEAAGAGEIFLNSIDRDGMMGGFDLKLIKEVSAAVEVPVVAVGGAGNLQHLAEGLAAGASAVAAGSMFVFHGKHRAVLINYPTQNELLNINGKAVNV